MTITSLATIVLLLLLIGLTCVIILFLYFIYRLMGGQPIPILNEVVKEEVTNETIPEDADNTVPIDQFTPDFTKSIGVKYIEDDEGNVVGVEEDNGKD